MMIRIVKRFSIIAGACLVVVGLIIAGSLHSPSIMGEDPYALLRYVLIRVTAAIVAAPFLGGLMLLTDYLTPGDWMETIGHDPKACSYVMSAVVIVVGSILCWA